MLKITKQGNSLIVEGLKNGTYPTDGVCEYPKNSLIAVTDESEMVTFRSAATNDVLFSGKVEDITINEESVTKDNILSKFDAVSNAPQGGGGGGGSVDAYTKAESDAKYGTKAEQESLRGDVENALGEIAALGYDKQDKLTAGDGITIEDNVISAVGGGEVTYHFLAPSSNYFNVNYSTFINSSTNFTYVNLTNNITIDIGQIKVGDYIKIVPGDYLKVLSIIKHTDKQITFNGYFVSGRDASIDSGARDYNFTMGCVYTSNNSAYLGFYTNLSTKQEKLTSGTNIKTINGESILGSGNIEIQGGDVDLSDYYTKEEADAIFEPKKIDYEKEYFTIEALEDGNISFLNAEVINVVKYSLNGGEWQTVKTYNENILLKNGDKVRLKGKRNSDYNGTIFGTITKCNVYGNINSLFSEDDFLTNVKIYSNHINGLFDNNNGSKEIVDASNLILPYESLANYCYSSMFNGCKTLIKTPELPATVLANSCYSSMFRGCTSLLETPELPATVLANSCYEYMFSGCTKLTKAPKLHAVTLVSYCYSGMFSGCTKLTKIICLAKNNIGKYDSTYLWVNSVSSSGTFVKGNGVEWTSGTNGVPSGWKNVDYIDDYIDLSNYPTKQEVNQTYLQKSGEYVKSATANGGSINFEKGNGTPDVVNFKTINNQSIIGMDNIKVPTDTDIESKVNDVLSEQLWQNDDALAVTEIGFWEDENRMIWTKSTLDGTNPQSDSQYFKTINGQSILGQGDIVVSGGGSIDMSDYYTKQQVDNLIPKIVTITQEEYDRIVKDENTIYLIKEDDNTSGGGDAGGYL